MVSMRLTASPWLIAALSYKNRPIRVGTRTRRVGVCEWVVFALDGDSGGVLGSTADIQL